MGTSKPAITVHDIPITKPYRPPRALPEPDPEHWITPMPIIQPAKEPVPARRNENGE